MIYEQNKWPITKRDHRNWGKRLTACSSHFHLEFAISPSFLCSPGPTQGNVSFTSTFSKTLARSLDKKHIPTSFWNMHEYQGVRNMQSHNQTNLPERLPDPLIKALLHHVQLLHLSLHRTLKI